VGGGWGLGVVGVWAALGRGAPAFHREVGETARAEGVDLLVGVGGPARDYGPDELVGDPEEAAELLAAQLEAGDTVLVKGSRSAGLEDVAVALEDLLGAPDRG
jgi:UDP-N-acetylmuramoyl-tripeptide--D-alanyl-D-alanine ligase